jgi:M6 family metalloprotease-like protein
MKRTLSFIIASALIFLCFGIAFAVPASPGLKEVKMPDGTTMQVRLIGDERISWLETADGYTILRNPDGYYEYAERDDSGQLIASGIKAGQKPLPEKKHIRQSRELISLRIMSMKMEPKKIESPSQITGTEKVIVLLVEFADVPHESPAHDPSYFNSLYFDSTFGTLNNYLQEMSYNQLNIIGATSDWGASVQNMAYYGYGQDPGMLKIGELVVEAVAAADPFINFRDYDQDGDGYVDHLIIVHSGGDYAVTGDPDDIWSHKWCVDPIETDDSLYADTDPDDDITEDDLLFISCYAMSSEDDLLGVHAHEFLHDLGAPDLYDYDYDGNPVGYWCIMDYGAYGGNPSGSVPTGICGYLRYDLDADLNNGYIGWLDVNVPTQDNNYTVTQLADSIGDRLYRIDIPRSYEYFLVENRQPVSYDASVPDTGIVIYHVDENMPDNAYDRSVGIINSGTPYSSFYRISVENPGGDYGKLDAAFSQDDAQALFDNYSAPNSKSNPGIDSEISITNTSVSQQNMTFYLSMTGSNFPPAVYISASPSIGAPPLTVTFTGTATDSDGTIVSYLYDFGDGTTSSQLNAVHTYNDIGNYTATFTATDDIGVSATAEVDIEVKIGGGGSSSSGGGCGTISGFDLKPPSSGQIILDIMFFMIPILVILGKRVYKVIRYQ